MDTTTLKGRNTIKRGGSVSGANGQTSRLIPRWRFDTKSNTTLAQLEAAYMSGLAAVDQAVERGAKNKTAGKLTREGSRDDLLSYALKELVPNLHKARLAVRKARDELAERKSKLKVEQPDPSDVAGAHRRREIRDRLREMKDQPLFFARHHDNIPDEIISAVLEMPTEFSGVPPERYEWLRERALASRYGAEMAELSLLEEAISVAHTVVETGRDEVRLEIGGIGQPEFDALAAPIEAKHAAPWLRRRDGEVHVVDLEKRIERKPTAEELAIGIFANIHDEYVREQTNPAAI